MQKSIFLCALLCSVFPVQAHAQEFDPKLSGSIALELQNDWAYKSDDPDAEVNTLYTSMEGDLKLSLTDTLAVQTHLVLEPVQDTDAGDDTEFENEGLFAEELKITYGTEQYGVQAGKFNPTFGMAWDAAPGIYGADFAEDYELTERLGFGGFYTFETEKSGNHTLSANTFFADTSLFSQSLITGRGELDKDDGGVSNTESLSSYSLTYDAEGFMGLTGLNTHLGYRNQSEGDADTGLEREKGYAIGAQYTHSCGENLEATVMGEWVGLRNSEGGQDDMDFYTAGAGLTIYKNWNLALSHTTRNTNVDGGDDVDDSLSQISAGYAFDNGIGFDVGYRHTEEDNTDTNMLGMFLTYGYDF
jgi:hypothetical protein